MKGNPTLDSALYALNARVERADYLARRMEELRAEERHVTDRAQVLMGAAKAGRFVSPAEVTKLKTRMAKIQDRKRLLFIESERLEGRLQIGTEHIENVIRGTLKKRAERAGAARKAGF